MSTLSQRGPNANTPAKLPGIQTSRVADPVVRQSLEALREWVEVRLGSRGDKWERAVTARDLETRLTQFQKDNASTTTTTQSTSALAAQVAQLAAALAGIDTTTVASLKTKLAVLAAQLAQLASQVAGGSGSSGTGAATTAFDKALEVDLSGSTYWYLLYENTIKRVEIDTYPYTVTVAASTDWDNRAALSYA